MTHRPPAALRPLPGRPDLVSPHRVLACVVFAAVAIAMGAQPAAAQCTRSVERTPLRFSADGGEVLVEVLERDDCFPDGVLAHRMERRRTEDLALVERIELLRGSRDWSDPSTWMQRSAEDVEAEIRRRRGRFLRERQRAFPLVAHGEEALWDHGELVVGELRLRAPMRGLRALRPYGDLPPVRVFVARTREGQALVLGTVDAAGRDRLVGLTPS
ncbi:MAG: hypothetical protein AAF447_11685 [Myxococcota bacterium]